MRNSVDRRSKYENKSAKKKTGIVSNSPFCEGKRADFEPRWLGLKLRLSHLSPCGVWQLNEPANGTLIGQMGWKILIAYSWWNRNIWWGEFSVFPKFNKWESNTNLVVKNCSLKRSLEQQPFISKHSQKKIVFICSKVNNGEKNYFILTEDGLSEGEFVWFIRP